MHSTGRWDVASVRTRQLMCWDTANTLGSRDLSGRFGDHIGEPFIDDAKSGGFPVSGAHWRARPESPAVQWQPRATCRLVRGGSHSDDSNLHCIRALNDFTWRHSIEGSTAHGKTVEKPVWKMFLRRREVGVGRCDPVGSHLPLHRLPPRGVSRLCQLVRREAMHPLLGRPPAGSALLRRDCAQLLRQLRLTNVIRDGGFSGGDAPLRKLARGVVRLSAAGTYLLV